MASEAEIERLIVRLVGDQTHLEATLDKAVKEVEDASAAIATTTDQIQEDLSHIPQSIEQAADEATKASSQLTDSLKEVPDQAQAVSDAISKWTGDISPVAEQIVADFQKLSATVQEVATSGDALSAEGYKQLEDAFISLKVEAQQLGEAVPGLSVDFNALEKDIDTLYDKMSEERAWKQTIENVNELGLTLLDAGKKLTLFVSIAATAYKAVALIDWSSQEEAIVKLNATLEANGRDVETTFQRYDKFATKIQNTTKYADELVQSLLQQAEGLGLTSDKAERAVKNALALESAYGASAKSIIRMTVALEQGDAQGLQRFLRPLRQVHDPIQKAELAQKLLTRAWKVAEAEVTTYKGQLALLSNQISELNEQIGKNLAEGMKPWITAAIEAVKVAQQLPPELMSIAAALVNIGVYIGPVISSLGMLTIYTANLLQILPLLKAGFLALGGVAGILSAIGTILGVTLVAAAGIAAIAVASYFSQTIFGVKEFNAQQEKSLQLFSEIQQKASGRDAKVIENLDKQENPFQKKAETESALKIAEKDAEGLEAAVKAAKNEVKELNTTWHSWTGNKVLAAAKDELAQVEARSKSAHDQLTKLKVRFEEVASVGKESPKKVKDLIKELETASKTVGMTTDEIVRMKAAKDGAIPADLKQIENLQKQISASKKAEEARKHADDQYKKERENIKALISSQEEELRLLDLTGGDLIKYQAFLKGANEEEQEEILNNRMMIDGRKKLTEVTDQLNNLGKSAIEIEIEKLRLQGTIKEADLQEIQSKMETIEFFGKLEEARKADEAAVKSTIKALTDESLTLGMTARQAAVFTAQMQGADEAQQKLIDGFHEEKELASVMEEVNKKFSVNKALDEYQKKQAQLNKLLKEGKIELSVFEKATKEARLEYNKIGDKKAIIKFESHGLEALEAGSADAFGRMFAQAQNMAMDAEKTVKKAAKPAENVKKLPNPGNWDLNKGNFNLFRDLAAQHEDPNAPPSKIGKPILLPGATGQGARFLDKETREARGEAADQQRNRVAAQKAAEVRVPIQSEDASRQEALKSMDKGIQELVKIAKDEKTSKGKSSEVKLKSAGIAGR